MDNDKKTKIGTHAGTHAEIHTGPVLRFLMPMAKGQKNAHLLRKEEQKEQFKGIWNLVKLDDSAHPHVGSLINKRKKYNGGHKQVISYKE